MSQNEVERFLGRLITDARFRTCARCSLEKVCYSKGFTLSTAEMKFLEIIDLSLVHILAESIDDSIKRT
jgi:hypothetical protein